jgi:hypothetical protein
MRLSVDLAAMSEFENQYHYPGVLNADDDPEVADAISPEARWRPFESLSDPPRVLRSGDALVEEAKNALSIFRCQLP